MLPEDLEDPDVEAVLDDPDVELPDDFPEEDPTPPRDAPLESPLADEAPEAVEISSVADDPKECSKIPADVLEEHSCQVSTTI